MGGIKVETNERRRADFCNLHQLFEFRGLVNVSCPALLALLPLPPSVFLHDLNNAVVVCLCMYVCTGTLSLRFRPFYDSMRKFPGWLLKK
ncbi:hypothetical protein V8C40DRAFT_245762 [Trichoderma camerunense]